MERSRPDISFHDGSLSSNSPKEPQHGDHEALYQALSDKIREQAREILELREQVASADISRGSNALNKSSKNSSMSCDVLKQMITISKEYKQVNRKLESSLNEKKNLRKTLEAREKELMAAERQVSVLQKALQESKAAGTSEPSQQGSNREALATLAKALKSLQNKFSVKEKEYDELFAKYNDVKNAADEEAAYNKSLKNALNIKAHELGLQGDSQGGVLEEVMKQKDTIRGLQKEKELLTQKLEEQARNQELSDIQSQSEEYLKLRQAIARLENEKTALLDHIDFIDNDNVMLESFYVTAEAIVNTLSNQMSRITRLTKAEKNKLREQCKYLETELSKVLQMLSHKDDLYAESKAVQEELLDALRDVKARAAQTENEVDRLRLVEETHQRCSQEMRKLIQDYEGDKRNLVEAVSNLNLELSSAKAEVEALKSAVDNSRNMEAEELSSMDRPSFASSVPFHRQAQLPLPEDFDRPLSTSYENTSMSSTTHSPAISSSHRANDSHHHEMYRLGHAGSAKRDPSDSLQVSSRDVMGMETTSMNYSTQSSSHLKYDVLHPQAGRQAHGSHGRVDTSSSLHHSHFDAAGDQTLLYSRADTSARRGQDINVETRSAGSLDDLNETPRYAAEALRNSLQDWNSMASANSPPPLKHQPSKPFLPSPPPQLTPKRPIHTMKNQRWTAGVNDRSGSIGGQAFLHADSLAASSEQTVLFGLDPNASRMSSYRPPMRLAQSEAIRSFDPLTPGVDVGSSSSITHKYLR
ncbi:hypothetical protein GUITHDRAFT_136114 [Guillardia theta CCMP2712]|uniref:Uncharacterized protein n=1 Tax=Guillardia theta (strain CCMP2712) TaxID=905079 RepID=L1JLN0_GUITC|nr:hypothetical protein GUITHDRAFT_136114 [Guillardia theta CCMP2712]EKX49451.1 hypothetical protein GUITHDRAFT_136114 [Guillardia theta CCMP2712]|eukprot:XP_005836431.1 hypothetical protein GUITHDRAFT_136114 [Guillardia theta CCMP2712]